MQKRRIHHVLAGILALGLANLACDPLATPTPTVVPTPTVPPLVVTTLDDVKLATIRIEAEGSFVDINAGEQTDQLWGGSGFIIDESGLAVTNSHVVTGSKLLKVYLAGDSKPHDAKVLGVSECSDLAVIDIDGDGYHYLSPYSDDIKTGLDIYAAGYPLGDPEFTLNRGIISKEKANGDTSWASVEHVLEHDATINPGNSGGPLITKDGQVLGVNYARNAEASQSFAIALKDAQDIIDQLKDGKDVDSIGLNVEAYLSEDKTSGAIWISSVEPGSPFAESGILAGDTITSLNDVPMAKDGTLADYCRIIHGYSDKDTLSIELLRYNTATALWDTYKGEINGKELEKVPPIQVTLPEGDSYSGFTTVTDTANIMTMDVPSSWRDVSSGGWQDSSGNIIGVSMSASTNLASFSAAYDTPGVFFGVTRLWNVATDGDTLLKANDFSRDCNLDQRYDYDDGAYQGAYEVWRSCSSGKSALVNLVAGPPDGSFLIFIQVQMVTTADQDALIKLVRTFQIIGQLP